MESIPYTKRHFDKKKNRSYKGAPKDIDWTKAKSDIESMIKEGCTYQFMGNRYNVSRQRIYQVIEDLGLSAPKRKKDLS